MTAEVALVADTRILIWYVVEPAKLSSIAITALEAATSAEQPIGVLSYAIVEMVYATEKPSNPFTRADLDAVLAVLDDPASPFEVIPITSEIAQEVAAVPRDNKRRPWGPFGRRLRRAPRRSPCQLRSKDPSAARARPSPKRRSLGLHLWRPACRRGGAPTTVGGARMPFRQISTRYPEQGRRPSARRTR